MTAALRRAVKAAKVALNDQASLRESDAVELLKEALRLLIKVIEEEPAGAPPLPPEPPRVYGPEPRSEDIRPRDLPLPPIQATVPGWEDRRRVVGW